LRNNAESSSWKVENSKAGTHLRQVVCLDHVQTKNHNIIEDNVH
jgi:hypothetical protein